MKNFVKAGITAVLAVTMLAGCGDSANKASESPSASPSTEAQSEKLSEAEKPEETEEATAENSEFVKVEHMLGETEVPKNPKKIVVFDFGALDTIDYLNLDLELAIPKSNVPTYLSIYEGDVYINAGDIKEPDLEKINEFEPDLIIIAGRQADYYEELSSIAPTIYTAVDQENYMESFEKNSLYLGEIFGETEKVEAKIADIKERIAKVNNEAKSLDKKALIILTNDGSISAYGSGSRFGFIHDIAGIPAVSEDIQAETHGESIAPEFISEKNPDILFVVDRTQVVGGTAELSDTLNNDLIASTNASKDGKIIILDPSVWYLSGGGLRSVELMVEDMENAIK